MPSADINDVQLYYERHGERGEPLVLVHGYTGDITDWRFQTPEFSTTHQLLTFDLRGHGRSEAPADRSAYTVGRMADDTEALIEHAGFERYHLVGHSMGGAIAQEIALRSARRLISLTLEDTSHKWGLSSNATVAEWTAKRHRIAEEEGMAAVAAMPSVLPRPPHLTAERQAETDARLARMSADAFIGAWKHGLQEWPGSEDRLSLIRTPTLVICGTLDFAHIEPARVLAAKIPGARLEMIADAGHAPQHERPDVFNSLLRVHLNATSSAGVK